MRFQKGHQNPMRGKGRGLLWLKDNAGHQGDDCLWWPMSLDSKGYGNLGYNGKTTRAHRLMCVLAKGEPPTPDHEAAHSCGNGHLGCVNPKHLSWKTRAQNGLDRRQHGTAATTRSGNITRRTPEQEAEIRKAIGTATVTELAKRFKTSRRTIERIRDGRTFRRGLSMTPKNIERRQRDEIRRRAE